jgi:Uncharacterised nucleotidyltransferase
MNPSPNTPAEAELLLRGVRTHADPESIERLTSLLQHEINWPLVIQSALEHGVLPLLYSNLRRHCRDAVPPAQLAELREHYEALARRTSLLTARLFTVLDSFGAHGIAAVPFKGPILAASVYGDPTLRVYGDLDILVHKEDIPRAAQLLVAQGYQQAGEGCDDLTHDPQEVAYLGPRYYVFLEPDQQVRIDLQWRLAHRYFSFSLDNAAIWPRLIPVPVAGRVVRSFAPPDLLLILCAHGCKHRWEAVKWICDVAELVRAHGAAIDWGGLEREATRFRAARMLRLGLRLAADLLGAELPKEMIPAVYADAKVRALALSVRRRFIARAWKPADDMERLVFYVRAKDSWRDRGRFFARYLSQWLGRALTPTSRDRAFLPLPRSLFFVHYLVRPLRLTAQLGWSGLARRHQRARSPK